MQRPLSIALLLLVCCTVIGTTNARAEPSGLIQLAQAQPAQPAAPVAAAPDPAAPAADAQAPEEPIGNVATVTGSASVIRNNETTPLKVKDDIYLNDVVQTAANSALGITFIDATTFNLKANAKITIDTYIYEDGGKNNAGIFDVAKGTVAFVAASVAKTGNMQITTPTATLGIRGTSGLVEVPAGGGASAANNIKLYPDADGRVGRIEVNDRAGARLGFLSLGASGFTIRPGVGGARVAAVPLTISPEQIQRDQGFVRQVHSTQTLGRQVVLQQREFRRANPGIARNNAPRRSGPNGLPGQNRTGPQQPGLQNRPGQQPGLQNRPENRPGQLQQAPGQQNRPGQPQQPSLQNRPGQPQQPGSPTQPGTPPRGGQLQQPGSPTQPGLPPRVGAPQQPVLPAQPGAPQGQPGLLNRIAPHVPGLSRVPGVQGAPAARPGLPGALPKRPAVTPPKGKLPKNLVR